MQPPSHTGGRNPPDLLGATVIQSPFSYNERSSFADVCPLDCPAIAFASRDRFADLATLGDLLPASPLPLHLLKETPPCTIEQFSGQRSDLSFSPLRSSLPYVPRNRSKPIRPRQCRATSHCLLIVTPQQFEKELAPFVEHKQKELTVEVAILENILAQSQGVDDPEKLKHFLYQAWHERHAHYVLLVGDSEVMPVRYMVLDRVTPAAFDYSFYPCDLYYADVAKEDGSFDDWNAQKDGFHAQYFGEVRGEKNKNDPINYDQIHYRPELAVGRWPVNTPEEVRTVVAKTIGFENRIAAQPPSECRAALICNSGWIDARGAMDREAESLPKGWKIEKRYYADPGVEAEHAAAQPQGSSVAC